MLLSRNYVLTMIALQIWLSYLLMQLVWKKKQSRPSSIDELQYEMDNRKSLTDFVSQDNLIIGAATSLPVDVIGQFVQFARLSCGSCSIMLFIHETQSKNNDFINLAAIYDITWLIYEQFDVSKYYPQPGRFIRKLRWWLYSDYFDYLTRKRINIDNVFLTDVRDVLFQTNIFAHMKTFGKGLYIFHENSSIPLGVSRKYRRAILTCFGMNITNQLANKTSFNSGTILGSWKDIHLYVTAMYNLIIKDEQKSCAAFNYDHHYHYYAVYLTDLFNRITIHSIPHATGFISVKADERIMVRNKFGLVLNKNQTIYSVIHNINYSRKRLKQHEHTAPPLTKNTTVDKSQNR